MITRRTLLTGLSAVLVGIPAYFMLPSIAKGMPKKNHWLAEHRNYYDGIAVNMETKTIYVLEHMTVEEFYNRLNDWFDLPDFIAFTLPVFISSTKYHMTLTDGYDLSAGSIQHLHDGSVQIRKTNVLHWQHSPHVSYKFL